MPKGPPRLEVDIAQLPYRPGVGIMLLNRDGLAFVAQRIDAPIEAWQMPQGGIDEGEDPKAAVFREMREEIGTDNADIIAESRDWLTYELPHELVPRVWKGRFRGQKQKWFALRFQGTDDEINIQTQDPEFRAWRWVEPGELPALIIPFKRQLYCHLLEEFAHLAKGRTGGPGQA